MIGEACVVDVSAKVQKNPDYQMTVKDLEEWENNNGRLNEHCVVLMRSGWDAKYSNSRLYFGTATPSDPKTYHFPGRSRIYKTIFMKVFTAVIHVYLVMSTL